MNILITGGAGYIGSHTVQALLRTQLFKIGHLFVFDNLTTGHREAVPEGATFIQADIRDTKFLSETLKQNKIEAIIHFAAKLIVPESVDRPLEYYDNNVNGVLSLATACRDVGVKKIIFSSTAAVYGEPSSLKPIVETDIALPINPYGMSKLIGERILRDCDKAFGLHSVCLRYFNVAGAALDGTNGQRSKKATHLVNVACQTVLGTRECVEIFGTDFPTPDGTGVRDYIHIEDLAELHILALHYLNQGGTSEVLNCGYGKGYSVREVLESMKKVSQMQLKTKEVSRRQGDPSSLVAQSEKLKKLFSWSPKYADLDLICKSALEWEKLKSQFRST